MIRKTIVMALASTLATCAEVTVDALHMNVLAKEEAVPATTWRGRTFDLESAAADTAAIDWITAASIIGTLLWFWSMLYYGKTTYYDNTMEFNEPPVAWFWSNITGPYLGWTAASYLAYFISYGLVSVVEFAAYCAYISGNSWFIAVWARYSTWTAFLTFIIPPIFATLQLSLPAANGGIALDTDKGFVNAVMLATVGYANWFFQSVVHFMFTERLDDHVKAKEYKIVTKMCGCAKGYGTAAQFKAQQAECYNTLKSFRCQELVVNKLNEKCEDAQDLNKCRQEKTVQCLAKYQKDVPAAARMLQGNGARLAMLKKASKLRPKTKVNQFRYPNTQIDYWTKCKAIDLVGEYKVDGTGPVVEEKEGKSSVW